MPTRYTVVAGDCLSSIAARHGFSNWRIVYDAPENADFRAKRPNPNVIYAGDVLFIPNQWVHEVHTTATSISSPPSIRCRWTPG